MAFKESDVPDNSISGVSVTLPVSGADVVAGDLVNFTSTNVTRNQNQILGNALSTTASLAVPSMFNHSHFFYCGNNLYLVIYNENNQLKYILYRYSETDVTMNTNGSFTQVSARTFVTSAEDLTHHDMKRLNIDGGTIPDYEGEENAYIAYSCAYGRNTYSHVYIFRVNTSTATVSMIELSESSVYTANYGGEWFTVTLPNNQLIVIYERRNNDAYLYDLYTMNWSSFTYTLTASQITLSGLTAKYRNMFFALYDTTYQQLILFGRYRTNDNNIDAVAAVWNFSNPASPTYISYETNLGDVYMWMGYNPYSGICALDDEGYTVFACGGSTSSNALYTIYRIKGSSNGRPSVSMEQWQRSLSGGNNRVQSVVRSGDRIYWLAEDHLTIFDSQMSRITTITLPSALSFSDTYAAVLPCKRVVSDPGIIFISSADESIGVKYAVAVDNNNTLLTSKYSTNASTMAIALNSASAGESCTALVDGYAHLDGMTRGTIIEPAPATEQDIYVYAPADNQIHAISRKYRDGL